ncbi:MAG: hypothetical protein ACRC2O_10295 [Chitinophagaceae bacterium]
MRKWPVHAFFYLVSLAVSAQSELPGIWNAGVAGQFYPVLAADSIHFAKISIPKKRIMVNLYAGFAVIKGEYSFENTTDQPINIKIGYPVSGRYPQPVVENVFYHDLYNFRAKANGKSLIPYRFSDSGNIVPLKISENENATTLISDWYTWQQAFPAREVTTLTVYYITQNNLARFKKGDESRDANAFGFNIESGKGWGDKIGSGDIFIKMNDKLSLTNIQGIAPDSILKGDLYNLQYSFGDLKYLPENNLVIWYDGAPPDFKFDKKVLPSTDTLYQMMDVFPIKEFNDPAFKLISRKNFSVSKSGLTFSGVVYFLMFFMPWIILAVVIVFLLKGRKKIDPA